MTVTTEILDRLFNDFANFVSEADTKPFTDFKTSAFIDKAENYKYSVYDEARENLGQKWWKPEDIGTGKIQQAVSSAIKTRVNHSFQMVDNNLVDWRKKMILPKQVKIKISKRHYLIFTKAKFPTNKHLKI